MALALPWSLMAGHRCDPLGRTHSQNRGKRSPDRGKRSPDRGKRSPLPREKVPGPREKIPATPPENARLTQWSRSSGLLCLASGQTAGICSQGVRAWVYGFRHMAATLGRQRVSDSLIERSLGRFGGWQMTTDQRREEVEIRTSAGQLISRARGASLGAVEADMLTWLLARWVQAGCPPDGGVRTTVYQLAAALYGPRRNGSADRRQAVDALINLHMASITLTDYDADGGEAPGRFVDVHLVRRIHYGEELLALREDRRPVSAAALGALRGETLTIYLDDWLILRLRDEALRAWLEWPVQRRLGAGVGKRLWLYLEPHPAFGPLRARPALEGVTLQLGEQAYAELGCRCAERRDNRKAIRRGAERILEIDRRYVLLELIAGQGGAPDRLRAIRRRRDAPPPMVPALPAGTQGEADG